MYTSFKVGVFGVRGRPGRLCQRSLQGFVAVGDALTFLLIRAHYCRAKSGPVWVMPWALSHSDSSLSALVKVQKVLVPSPMSCPLMVATTLSLCTSRPQPRYTTCSNETWYSSMSVNFPNLHHFHARLGISIHNRFFHPEMRTGFCKNLFYVCPIHSHGMKRHYKYIYWIFKTQ